MSVQNGKYAFYIMLVLNMLHNIWVGWWTGFVFNIKRDYLKLIHVFKISLNVEIHNNIEQSLEKLAAKLLVLIWFLLI